MPQTIQSKIRSYELSNLRRSLGQSSWDRSIDIKSILKRDPDNKDNAYLVKVGNQIGTRLRGFLKNGILDHDHDLFDQKILDIVETLEDMRLHHYTSDKEYTPQTDLNDSLDELYDWADQNRIWLGP